MSGLFPPVAMRKNVPKSTNLIDNDVGRAMKQETSKARQKMDQRLESEKTREVQRLNQRIQETKQLDVFA